MNLKLVFIVLLIFLLIGFVSADLCKGKDGYYHDCENYVSKDINQKTSTEINNDYLDISDYKSCIEICLLKYSNYYYQVSDKLKIRTQCFTDCKTKKSYIEEIKHITEIKDKGSYISTSFEDSIVIEDKYENYYGNNNYEYIYLDKREYEIEKMNSYGSPYPRGEVYVYVPYNYLGEEEDSVYDWNVKKVNNCDFWCWLGF